MFFDLFVLIGVGWLIYKDGSVNGIVFLNLMNPTRMTLSHRMVTRLLI